MKKMNHKQLAYSRSKVMRARIGLYQGLIFSLIILVGSVLIGAALVHSPINWDSIVTILTGSGIGLANMAAIGNLGEISDKLSSSNQIGMRVWLIAVDQVDQAQAFPTPNGDREIGTIPLIAGEVPHYFDAVPDSIDETGTATKGDIITEFSKTFAFVVASNREKHLDFIEDYAGKGFIIIYQLGEDAAKYLVGSVYKPMVLMTSERKGGGKEGRYITFTFQNKHWRQPLKYVGAIAVEAPATIAAGATTLAVTSASQYQLSDHSAPAVIGAVSGIGSADIGRVIEVLAPATDNNSPTIADNAVFVLMDAGTWTANPGSRISLKILGAATLVEVPGTRVQTT